MNKERTIVVIVTSRYDITDGDIDIMAKDIEKVLRGNKDFDNCNFIIEK